MKTISLLLIALLLSPVAGATEFPDAPVAKIKPDRRVFGIGEALLAGSKIADQITTRQLLDRGGWENDPLFGRYPSPARQAGISSLAFLTDSTLFYFTEHSRHSWIRWSGRAYVGLVVANHFELAACNSKLDPASPKVHNCHPLLPF